MNAAEFSRRRARIESNHNGRTKRYKRELAHLVRDARAALVVMHHKVVGWRLPNGEMVCIKDRYRDEASALHDMERIQAANWSRSRVPVRAHHCAHCHGWHLTSQARNAQ